MKRILLVFMIIFAACKLSYGQNTQTFTNPLLPHGPDPWAIYKDGSYYYTHTMGDRITLWKTPHLTALKNAESKTVWEPPAEGPNSSNIWAPELHFLDGKWYLYYTAADAADPGDHTRNVFVLENAAADPLQGTWTDKGKVNTHYQGLDGSVFEYKGQRYFLYSAYVGPQSNLFIATMLNPWTLSDTQVEIARPTYDWEKHDNREILEGPEFLEGKNGKVFIIYSGSACWDDNYALGMLTASGTSNLLQADAWKKSPDPVFSTSIENGVYGPGHNGFFKSPDGTEDWIIYHAKSVANGECRERNVRMQKFTWNADGTPNFDTPVPVNAPLQKPSGE